MNLPEQHATLVQHTELLQYTPLTTFETDMSLSDGRCHNMTEPRLVSLSLHPPQKTHNFGRIIATMKGKC